MTGITDWAVWVESSDPLVPHTLTIDIDSDTATGNYRMCYVIKSSDLEEFKYENCFDILLRDCIVIYQNRGDNWIRAWDSDGVS